MTKAFGSGTQNSSWIDEAFGGLGLPMLTTDTGGRVVLINESACKLLDVQAPNVVGRTLDQVVGLWDTKSNAQVPFPMAQVLERGIKLSNEAASLVAFVAGQQMRVSLSLAPIRDEVGAVVGCVVTFCPGGSIPVTQIRPPMANGNIPFSQAIFVRTGGKYVRVLLSELLWVEAMENYVQLQTTKERIVVHATLKSIGEALAVRGFRRIHRSFIVKTDAIESIEENQVIVNGMPLPIGKSYRSELLDGLTLI